MQSLTKPLVKQIDDLMMPVRLCVIQKSFYPASNCDAAWLSLLPFTRREGEYFSIRHSIKQTFRLQHKF